MPKKKRNVTPRNHYIYGIGSFVVVECFDKQNGGMYYTTLNRKLFMHHPVTGIYMNVHRHYHDKELAILIAKRAYRKQIPPNYSASMKNDILYLLGEKVDGG